MTVSNPHTSRRLTSPVLRLIFGESQRSVSHHPPCSQPTLSWWEEGGGDFLKEPRFVFVKMKTKTISKYYPEQLHLQKEHQSTSKTLTLVRKKGQKALKDSFTFCESVVILFRRFSVLTIWPSSKWYWTKPDFCAKHLTIWQLFLECIQN